MPQRTFCTMSSAGACAQVLRHRIESCLAAGRSVVVAGDLNIGPYPFDHDNFADVPAWSAQHPAAKAMSVELTATVCCRLTFLAATLIWLVPTQHCHGAVPDDIALCNSGVLACRVQEGMLDGRPDRVWLRELLQPEGGPLVDLHRWPICAVQDDGRANLKHT